MSHQHVPGSHNQPGSRPPPPPPPPRPPPPPPNDNQPIQSDDNQPPPANMRPPVNNQRNQSVLAEATQDLRPPCRWGEWSVFFGFFIQMYILVVAFVSLGATLYGVKKKNGEVDGDFVTFIVILLVSFLIPTYTWALVRYREHEKEAAAAAVAGNDANDTS